MPYIPNLRNHRLKLLLSQSKLAGKAEIDRATVSRCENGYAIQEISCVKIRDALNSAGFKGRVEITEGGIAGEMPKKGKLKST